MIEVKGLTKRFDNFTALEAASFTAEPGRVCGIVGPNGAGKTTLIKHLVGVYRPDEGSVLLDGAPIFENPAAKARIGYIPDDRFFFTKAGIGEMMRQYRSFYPGFSQEKFDSLRQVFNLDEKQPLRKFSKGMQKQAAFWLTMACRPDIYVLDEPVDGLDPVMRRAIWGLIMGEVAERNVTVLVSSHNLRELEDVCDKVCIMDKGRIVIEHSLEDLQANTVKVQTVLPQGAELPAELKVLSRSLMGRVTTLILRCSAAEAKNRLSTLNPILLDVLPLTLEEIFIYELGGESDESKKVV
ncbi:MAG: ABC transporter ATP-binding protein [Oscillospiraceae bacterium]|nr:ABC transporter ATP-binding protein [Oscillospiraceae bacterium]